MEEQKNVHTIILDAGPLIKNDPSASSLLKNSHKIVTIPQVIAEIRDENTRSRLDTILKPFLDIREPRPDAVKFITDFSRRTGDLAVLSRPDILLLALAYEIECERSGGDWRLRKVPGQKGLNGTPPQEEALSATEEKSGRQNDEMAQAASQHKSDSTPSDNVPAVPESSTPPEPAQIESTQPPEPEATEDPAVKSLGSQLSHTAVADEPANASPNPSTPITSTSEQPEEAASDSSDSEGWITPSNLKKHQAKDTSAAAEQPLSADQAMGAAILTSDYAMQNVALQMNLNLLSPALNRIKKLNTYILRCHACFEKVKDLSKQFCPRCGKPALTKVACSTNAKGEFRVHLKKGYQYNKRGDRYSIPKPVSSSASGRVNAASGGKGGGKGGWGQELILAEDQKEYQKAVRRQRWTRERDVMDEDYLPNILTGDRSSTGGRPKIGAGRNINARKR